MSLKDTLISKKRRGPSPTGHGIPILVRVTPDMLTALDIWRASVAPSVSRPEAVRRLLQESLQRRGIAGSE